MIRPYELLARFAPDGSIAGVSVRTITTVDGRDYESDPVALSGSTDPAFVAFASQFAAAAVAARDAAVSERDAALQSVEAVRAEMQAEIDRLTERIPPPPNPREITPREFLSRISDADKLAIWNSSDPRCVGAMLELFTAGSIHLDSPILAGMVDLLIESGVPIDAEERARIFA